MITSKRSWAQRMARAAVLLAVVATLVSTKAIARNDVLRDGRRHAAFAPAFPYGSATFTRFVADSFANVGGGQAGDFARWMDAALARHGGIGPGRRRTWREALAAERRFLTGQRGQARVGAERAWVATLHKTVKRTIPRFDLQRGYEFAYTVRRGERQCFLQSVLIAALLQETGIPAGVAMVARNTRGEWINLRHAVAVAKLSDGRHVIVDASEPHPFARQQGLFMPVEGRGYQFLTTALDQAGTVCGYRHVGAASAPVPIARVQTLDILFLRSQFDYYRGEQVPTGVFGKSPTPAGLAKSARYLVRSHRACPRNPLAAYVLGRAYAAQRKPTQAARQYAAAHALYVRAGWVPPGPAEAYARSRGSHTARQTRR
jgi:hypothetical protein